VSLRAPLVRWVDQFLAKLIRSESLILKEWTGLADSVLEKPGKKRLCLFSHFDHDGKVDDYVVYFVKSLKALGADILFISTSENLLESEIEKVRPYCVYLIQRKNIGLDFGSWQIGWARANTLYNSVSRYDQLILANDSVYGPFFPMMELFTAMEKKNLDFWGVSSSEELTYHLQSYFLVFESLAMKSEALAGFWNRFLFYRSKGRIIQEYETGLTRLALANRWKIGAWVEFNRAKHQGVNSTLFSWDTLIENERFPFLKTEVLKLNRARSDRLPFWAEILKTHSSYPVALIQDHLNRI